MNELQTHLKELQEVLKTGICFTNSLDSFNDFEPRPMLQIMSKTMFDKNNWPKWDTYHFKSEEEAIQKIKELINNKKAA